MTPIYVFMRDASSMNLVNIAKYGEYMKMYLWYVHIGGAKREKLKKTTSIYLPKGSDI